MPTSGETAFFSYSRADGKFALKLAEDLRTAGADIWMDQIDIEPGTPWDRSVEDALHRCPRMVVVLSPVSASSDNVSDEVSYALSKHKHIIPVLYLDCELPFRLARLQYIDFRADYDHGLKMLVKVLAAGQNVATSVPALDNVAARPSPPLPSPAALQAAPAGRTGLRFWAKPAIAVGLVLGIGGATYVALHRKSADAPTTQVANTTPSTNPPDQPQANTGNNTDLKPQPSAPQTGTNSPASSKGEGAIPSKKSTPTSPLTAKSVPDSSTSSQQEHADSTRKSSAIQSNPPEPDLTNSGPRLPQGMDTSLADKYRKAIAGDSNAMVNLGFAYAHGNGVPQDYAQSVAWYRKSVALGNAAGMVDLGRMYETGRGVPLDYYQAVSWYRKAADAGNAIGMTNLGAMYLKGLGTKKDKQQAIYWYTRAAQLGNDTAKDNLQRLGVKPK